jgi:DDE family transposase
MATATPLFEFLEYSVGAVEAAIARGETPRFEAATPTFYDAFFTLADQLGVLAGIEALADPRPQPYVPLSLLVMLTICRFLHGHTSFRRVGEILLKDQALLQRLGLAPAVCEQGYYRNGARQPFNEEQFSEVFRHLDPEPLQALLAQAVQALQGQQPDWFREGCFLLDSNHFTLKGSRQEYKWCALLLWTPRGLFPVALEFSPVPGDGETTIGQRVVARALATYGAGFLRLLIMDAGYLDGPWLRELREAHGIDWVIKAKEGMVVVTEMERRAQERAVWRPAPPPKLDLPQAQLPTRHLCHTPTLYGFTTYGAPVNGCVVRDRYPPSAKHPAGLETREYLLTSRLYWKGAAIHTGYRRRWDVESMFNQLTRFWGLGKWGIGLFPVYRVLILLLALTLTVLQAHLTRGPARESLQAVADRLAVQQREPRVLVRVEGACVVAGPPLLNHWLATGVLVFRPP